MGASSSSTENQDISNIPLSTLMRVIYDPSAFSELVNQLSPYDGFVPDLSYQEPILLQEGLNDALNRFTYIVALQQYGDCEPTGGDINYCPDIYEEASKMKMAMVKGTAYTGAFLLIALTFYVGYKVALYLYKKVKALWNRSPKIKMATKQFLRHPTRSKFSALRKELGKNTSYVRN
jgi:hypothetical protein